MKVTEHQPIVRTCAVCNTIRYINPVYEIDTWNIGHYGCAISNAPRIFKGYERDYGCPVCTEKEEEEYILECAKQILIERSKVV